MERECGVCGEKSYRVWLKSSGSPGPVVRCIECGFVYVNPIESQVALITEGPVLDGRSEHLLTSSDVGEIRGSWEEPMIEAYMREAEAKRINAREAIRSIDRFAERRGRLLDVGCYCGLFLDVATEDGWECVGIEPLVMAAIYARGVFGLSVVTGTLRDDTFEPESFDVVTAFQVFEHLVDLRNEVRRMCRLIKPGGLLVVETPNIETCSVRLLGSRHRHFVQDHVNFFSAKTLARMLDAHGFRVVDCFYPKRVISLRHLVHWSERLAGKGCAAALKGALKPLGLDTRTIRIGVGDIITVIARREA